MRERLYTLAGRRMTADGVIVITAARFRSQLRNREDARDRLVAVLQAAGADLLYKNLPTGHNLTQNDLITAADWLEHLQ